MLRKLWVRLRMRKEEDGPSLPWVCLFLLLLWEVPGHWDQDPVTWDRERGEKRDGGPCCGSATAAETPARDCSQALEMG